MKKKGNKTSLPSADVITAFKNCARGKSCDNKCPYYLTQYRCRSKDLMEDVIQVLERQQQENRSLHQALAAQEGTV